MLGKNKETEKETDDEDCEARDVWARCRRCKGAIDRVDMIRINEKYNFEVTEKFCIVKKEIVDEDGWCKHFRKKHITKKGVCLNE